MQTLVVSSLQALLILNFINIHFVIYLYNSEENNPLNMQKEHLSKSIQAQHKNSK